ncbi:MAG: VIT family protein [Pseudomonadota bacterium]
MTKPRHHNEHHRTGNLGWLRAAVLGANDGIVSTASLIVGVAAAGTEQQTILLSGIAGWVAGAMSMAAGEYVSVHSQVDAEKAELVVEKQELEADPAAELRELASIYVKRGLEPELAKQVAAQLSAHDALGAHARDELGLTAELAPRPIQAAFSSALSFTGGAALPLLLVVFVHGAKLIPVVSVASLLFLALLGGIAARAGGANVTKGAMRVTFWSALAMAVTAGVGALVGTTV